MMDGCNKCMSMKGGLLLIAGILFLLRDLNVWTFWNIQWWTVAFLIVGLGKLAMNSCKDCQSAMCGMEMPKSKKR